MSPPAATAITRDSGNTPRAVTPETLIRDTHRLMEAVGIERSPRWTHRVIRDYWASPIRGVPFGTYLAARLELNAQQRAELNAHPDLRSTLTYVDNTGEDAARHVDREQRRPDRRRH